MQGNCLKWKGVEQCERQVYRITWPPLLVAPLMAELPAVLLRDEDQLPHRLAGLHEAVSLCGLSQGKRLPDAKP